MSTIYKIVSADLWRQAENEGRFAGAGIDLADGYIHFSTADQAKETAARHFAGQHGLLLVAVDADQLGANLKYEASRGGALFPHLYATLSIEDVVWDRPITTDEAGLPVLPPLDP